MAKKTQHYIFVDKKLDQDNELKKTAIYGSLRELYNDNNIVIKNKEVSERVLRYTLEKNWNHYEDENICIKKVELQRSKMKNLNKVFDKKFEVGGVDIKNQLKNL